MSSEVTRRLGTRALSIAAQLVRGGLVQVCPYHRKPRELPLPDMHTTAGMIVKNDIEALMAEHAALAARVAELEGALREIADLCVTGFYEPGQDAAREIASAALEPRP